MRNYLIITVLAAGMLAGCTRDKAAPYDHQLAPGETALRKITDPAAIPDFTAACLNTHQLSQAIDNSLNYLAKPSSQRYFPCGEITHERAVVSLEAFLELLKTNMTASQRAAVIREKFDVYESVGCDNKGTVLFTGYYTPIFDGSRKADNVYRYPLYKAPEGLVKDDDGNVLGCEGAGGMRPCPSRAELPASGMLRGRELVWMKDPFEVYIAHVQGSARLRMPDGEMVNVGYEANNGHDYVSIGSQLVEDGKIPSDKLSLTTMIDYFASQPEEADIYINRNPRFVFFRFIDGPPHGSLNEPVTPWRTIATDKSIFPRGCLTLVVTQMPRMENVAVSIKPFRGLMLDQDTGGAIRAAGRCDIYLGVGDEAGQLAGATRQEGRLYYLFLKEGETLGENPEPEGPLEDQPDEQ